VYDKDSAGQGICDNQLDIGKNSKVILNDPCSGRVAAKLGNSQAEAAGNIVVTPLLGFRSQV